MKNLIILTIIASSFGVDAQKYGFVESEKLILSLPEVQLANKELETLKAQLTKQGQDMVMDLQKRATQLEAKKPELAPVEFEKQTEALKADQAKLQEFEAASQKQMYERSNALLSPIEGRVNEAIKAVAKEEGYSYVFDKSHGIILYADKSSDISDKVLAKITSK